MTKAHLKERVAFWQRALRLTDWRFDVLVEKELVDADVGAFAYCDAEDDYDSADLAFLSSWLKDASHEEIEYAVVHELLHAAMRNYCWAVAQSEEHLAPAVKTMWLRQLRHAEEGLVDNLARAIIAINGD